MRNEERAGVSVSFFLLGIAAAAGLGVLFAPKAGRDTRRQLRRWVDEGRDESHELMERLRRLLPRKSGMGNGHGQL